MAPPTLAPLPNASAVFEALARSVERNEPLPVPTFLQPPKPLTGDYRHDFTAEIEEGVELLDEILGRGAWIGNVDLVTLDLAADEHCLLAQLTHSSYCEGVVKFGGPDYNDRDVDEWEPYEWGTRYGFAVPEVQCQLHGGFRLYAQLTNQWVAKIGQLRAEVTA